MITLLSPSSKQRTTWPTRRRRRRIGSGARQAGGDDAISSPWARDRPWATWLINFYGNQARALPAHTRERSCRGRCRRCASCIQQQIWIMQKENHNVPTIYRFVKLSTHHVIMYAGSRKFPWTGGSGTFTVFRKRNGGHSGSIGRTQEDLCIFRDDGDVAAAPPKQQKDACTTVRNQTARTCSTNNGRLWYH